MRREALFAAIAVLSPPLCAADWTSYATLASDRMSRGVSLIETGPALAAGAEGRFDDGLVAGASASRVQREWWYRSDVSGSVEVDAYAGADFALGDSWRARAIATRYFFPGSRYARDWNEVTASVAFEDRLGASFAWSARGLGSPYATRTSEAWASQPLGRMASVELVAGNVSLGGFDYWYARAGVSRRIGRFVVDAAYHAADPDLRRFGFDERSRRVVVSISTAW
jgi:uncharacterized protein (TIGR02001 family)